MTATRTARRRPHTRDTSREAYRHWLHHSPSVDAKILRFLRDRGDYGATDAEIEAALHLSHQTVSADRRHMVERSEVHASDRKRPTPSGRKATVWLFGPAPTTECDAEGQWKLAI